MTTAISVTPGLFAQPKGLRAGDLISACNFLEYIREKTEHPELKLYFEDGSLQPSSHVDIMRYSLITNTNYISFMNPENKINLQVAPGTDPTYPNMYNLWNIRKDVLYKRQMVFEIEDKVKIINKWPQENLVVIAPLTDADYNKERNWSLSQTQDIVDNMCNNYPTFQKIIASKEPIPGLRLNSFEYEHRYEMNLNLIMRAKVYVGGDSGLSHWASVLDPGPVCYFHYSKNTYGTTNPFYWASHKDCMVYY